VRPGESAVVSTSTRDEAVVVASFQSRRTGLTDAEVVSLRARYGPNAIRQHKARFVHVLAAQLKSPLLLLLFATAVASAFLGETTDAVIITVILLVSVGLGFVNEYRAARTADSMHDRMRHTVVVVRNASRASVDVTDLVPGDIVVLAVGTVVPADLRLLECDELVCDEGIVTGESVPVPKAPARLAAAPTGLGDLTSCALMGTVVHGGGGIGVVVATGPDTEFGRIAQGLGEQNPRTAFQLGLARFSRFLLIVAISLTTLIVIGNVLLGRPLLDSLLFSLAIAVGITPQLLPAIVSASLAAGSRVLARRRVLVKRLVCIEDLGDLDLLLTDKTGTLTTGRIAFSRATPVGGHSADEVIRYGPLATEADLSTLASSTLGLNPLDAALWQSEAATRIGVGAFRRIALLPFDHERRMTSALVADAGGSSHVVTKGAAESVLPRCRQVPHGASTTLSDMYREGARVIVVAARPAPGLSGVTPADELDLELVGFLEFADPPKANAKESLDRLTDLGITVKIATGDSAGVAEHVCSELGMSVSGTLTGDQIDGMDDAQLGRAARESTIFARVSPEQKSRLVGALRHSGWAVGFLGDGVNDALALHRADIGISVDSAVDVAKDAADVVLLDKDLGVLAEGVAEGRRIFANTIKYVLMGTSSNFGNMFSASIASVVLSFLPMLPGQILLNNLLYDTSQLAIPTDQVDKEQLTAPSHWDIGAIRRFMLIFGPISSLFDFATFALMLTVFHAAPAEFRTGWFIESMATQTLIIFAIRTRRTPFLRSRPSALLTAAALTAVGVSILLPYLPVSQVLGFTPLPAVFFFALLAMVIGYLVLVEVAKVFYYRSVTVTVAAGARRAARSLAHHVERRAARFTAHARS
jgi:Mg2+-importing ATPase